MDNLEKKKPIERVAVIHDLCSVGKAALTSILPVLSVMGIEACPIPTMVLSAHTGGYGQPILYKMPDFAGACAEHLAKNGISFEHLFIGYLGSATMIQNIQGFLKYYPGANILLDPIMADHGSYYTNFDSGYCDEMRKLLQCSHIITPNYTESCFLSGVDYEASCNQEKLWQICRKLTALGAKQIVITSVPLPNAEMGIAVYENTHLHILNREQSGRAYPGTGDLFAAVLLGSLIRGHQLLDSARKAHDFVRICVKMSDKFAYPVREGVMLEANLKELSKIV